MVYSLLSFFLLVLLSSLSVCFSQHGEGKDYPSSGFPFDREWAAFELSLTEASSRSQARAAQTYGGAEKRVMSEIEKSGGREGCESEAGDKQD